MHHDDKIEGEDNKPHIILHDNECKSGVDNMNKLVGTFSCKRKTNRWPMAVFFNMIDVARVAALLIWLYNPGVNSARSRRKFLMTLGEKLATEHIPMRLQNPRAVQKHARQALTTLGYLKAESTDQPKTKTDTKQRCELCPRNFWSQSQDSYAVNVDEKCAVNMQV